MMELVNELTGLEPSSSHDIQALKFSIEKLLLLLSPFTPHIAEELWEMIGYAQSISLQSWPMWDEEMAKDEQIELVIQINGKLRNKLMISQGLPDETVKEMALKDDKVAEAIAPKSIKKVIVIKGRLVNIVTG
jgi:leucyl-tRNA synthetase